MAVAAWPVCGAATESENILFCDRVSKSKDKASIYTWNEYAIRSFGTDGLVSIDYNSNLTSTNLVLAPV